MTAPRKKIRPLTPLDRVRTLISLVVGLRRHDLRAARTFVRTKFASHSWAVRWWKFLTWSWRQAWREIPDASRGVAFEQPISRVPIWLDERNPLANFPWTDTPDAKLPELVDTVVIGAGFTGASLAYHWSKTAPDEKTLVVLEMDDPASGSSGRNEGLVVMGRYFAHVRKTVLPYLARVRTDLDDQSQDRLARQFAAAYCNAAYKNADMIEQTIKNEGFDCDYARRGWVQAADDENQDALRDSVNMANETGFSDWTRITPEEVLEKTGMHVRADAGYSIAAASFHPAKWVWSLLAVALTKPNTSLFTQTKVQRIENHGETYHVHTSRGLIRARHVVNATESYTPLLHKNMHNLIQPTQTQAASGVGGPSAAKPHVGISGPWFFCGRHGDRFMVGSDATRVSDHEAGRVQPSRFLTRFLLGEARRHFGDFSLHLTHEWSGSVGYTPDEFPIVGLLDDHRQYVIGGMAGSGTAVSFNAGRCICNRILKVDGDVDAGDGDGDDYPPEYFSPTRLLDPRRHVWPEVEAV